MIEALGGLGFFLLGMSLMTDGLHGLAGHTMRRALTRFTHSPLSGAITGTCSTALLQSSSATTVAAIGFVGASLLTFPQALGIIFGANIGTTFKGWIIALLGFKVQLGMLALLFVFIGALMKLLGQTRMKHLGLAIAGFGLIFVGIGQLQVGMLGLRELIDLSGFAEGSWLARLQLLLLGAGITIITQSSSAGVAITLTALHTGTVSLEQACALVVGMDVGTTATAALATIGGSINARRTGFSHVIYNLLTGCMAFLLIGPYLYFSSHWLGSLEQEFVLVAFHSSFNFLGVLLVLPFANQFARLIIRLFPSDDRLTQSLDRQLLSQPELAISAAENSLRHQLSALLQHLRALLSNNGGEQLVDLPQLQAALDETQQYLDDIHLGDSQQRGQQQNWQRLVYAINILDHLQRLHERCEEDADRARVVREREDLNLPRQQLLHCIDELSHSHRHNEWQQVHGSSKALAKQLRHQHKQYRKTITGQIGDDSIDVDVGRHYLEGARWLERVSHHLARISKHLNDQQISQTSTDGKTVL